MEGFKIYVKLQTKFDSWTAFCIHTIHSYKVVSYIAHSSVQTSCPIGQLCLAMEFLLSWYVGSEKWFYHQINDDEAL